MLTGDCASVRHNRFVFIRHRVSHLSPRRIAKWEWMGRRVWTDELADVIFYHAGTWHGWLPNRRADIWSRGSFRSTVTAFHSGQGSCPRFPQNKTGGSEGHAAGSIPHAPPEAYHRKTAWTTVDGQLFEVLIDIEAGVSIARDDVRHNLRNKVAHFSGNILRSADWSLMLTLGESMAHAYHFLLNVLHSCSHTVMGAWLFLSALDAIARWVYGEPLFSYLKCPRTAADT